MTKNWLTFLTLLNLGSCAKYQDKYGECALVLTSTGRSTASAGRSLCIRYEDVDGAFLKARLDLGLRRPARESSDQTLALLGTVLQETTRILKNRFSLTSLEVSEELPKIDTTRTDIGRFCPRHLSPAVCHEERYRRHDATCNNLRNPSWGAAGIPFARLLQPLYADGVSSPRRGKDGFNLPNPRSVSTRVHSDVNTRHEHSISLMFPAWGQLIDHDLTLTAETKDPVTRRDLNCCSGGTSLHPNCHPIPIPGEDNFYNGKGQTCMNMARSLAGVRIGCRLGPRVQINSLTSYIDANFIYGSSYKVGDSLRTLHGGLLRTVTQFQHLKPILPPKTKQPDDGCLRPHPDMYCFLAGDNRVNEQLALGVLHTLAVREHNRIARILSDYNPHWDDEKLYQETRHIMAALVQHITYNEFLPTLLGEKYMKQYQLSLTKDGYSEDYDEGVDASVSAAFATAAFRFGHSLLPRAMQRRSPSHSIVGERRLHEMLQQPFDLYKAGAVDEYALGMVSQLSQAMDSSVTVEVTNHLFQVPARDFGRDLATINIARAREHGVPGFMEYRRTCGLEDMHTWADMFNNFPNFTINSYLQLYSAAEDVDLWSAGISESPARGSLVGPVFSCIIAITFRNLKRGDRFWYENPGYPSSFTSEQLREIKKYKLSRMICNSGDNIYTIQPYSMLLPDYRTNPRVSCRSKEIPDLDLSRWKEKVYYNSPSYSYSSEVPYKWTSSYQTTEPHENAYSKPVKPVYNGFTDPEYSTNYSYSPHSVPHHHTDKYTPSSHKPFDNSNLYRPSIVKVNDSFSVHPIEPVENYVPFQTVTTSYFVSGEDKPHDNNYNSLEKPHVLSQSTYSPYSNKPASHSKPSGYENNHKYTTKPDTNYHSNPFSEIYKPQTSKPNLYEIFPPENEDLFNPLPPVHPISHPSDHEYGVQEKPHENVSFYVNKSSSDGHTNYEMGNYAPSNPYKPPTDSYDEEKNKIISFSQLISDLIYDRRNRTPILQLVDSHGIKNYQQKKAVTLD